MPRLQMLEATTQILGRAGFIVSDRCDLRPVSFDLVARRDGDLLLLKVLVNVDALTEPIAREIKLLAKFLSARPLLLGLKSGAGPLEDGVVYARHDIPIVTINTLAAQYLEGESPLVFAAPGGFYVRMDPRKLKLARLAAGASLGTLASVAGVSRRAIQMYEQGMNASIDAAMRLEDFLGTDLIVPLDPRAIFDPATYEVPQEEDLPDEDPVQAMIQGLLEQLGYEVRRTHRSPFQAISTQGDSFMTGMGVDGANLRRRAAIVANLANVIERPGFFVVHGTTKQNLHGTPVVSREELMRMTDPEQILRLILERQAS